MPQASNPGMSLTFDRLGRHMTSIPMKYASIAD
jgi:hypothetical protein